MIVHIIISYILVCSYFIKSNYFKSLSYICMYIIIGSSIDFNSDPITITINAGATIARANISVACDDVLEGLETFDMRLTLTSNSSSIALGRDAAEGQIIDSTGKWVYGLLLFWYSRDIVEQLRWDTASHHIE